MTAEDLLEPVERLVVDVLRRGDVGQEPLGRQPLLHRLRRGGGREDAGVAAASAVLQTPRHPADQLGRDVVVLLGDVLADPLTLDAAGGAGLLGVGQVDDDLDAPESLRDGPAAPAGPGLLDGRALARVGLDGLVRLSRLVLELLASQHELARRQLLGSLAEEATAQDVEPVTEPFDLVSAALQIGAELAMSWCAAARSSGSAAPCASAAATRLDMRRASSLCQVSRGSLVPGALLRARRVVGFHDLWTP